MTGGRRSAMTRIVISCDGTWNTSEQGHPTNVVKVRDAALRRLPDGTEQAIYYHDGVATRSCSDRRPGGIFGAGLWQNVQSVYEYLVEHFEAGDELFSLGSAGALTRRAASLAWCASAASCVRKRSGGYKRPMICTATGGSSPTAG